jgi:hypothetical protein
MLARFEFADQAANHFTDPVDVVDPPSWRE